MKKILMLLMILTIFFFLPGNAFSAHEIGIATGMDLYRASNIYVKQSQGHEVEPEETIFMLLALGYITGFNDASVVTHAPEKNKFFKLPDEGVENEQIMLVINKYFTEHPDILHESARICLLAALNESFPPE